MSPPGQGTGLRLGVVERSPGLWVFSAALADLQGLERHDIAPRLSVASFVNSICDSHFPESLPETRQAIIDLLKLAGGSEVTWRAKPHGFTPFVEVGDELVYRTSTGGIGTQQLSSSYGRFWAVQGIGFSFMLHYYSGSFSEDDPALDGLLPTAVAGVEVACAAHSGEDAYTRPPGTSPYLEVQEVLFHGVDGDSGLVMSADAEYVDGGRETWTSEDDLILILPGLQAADRMNWLARRPWASTLT